MQRVEERATVDFVALAGATTAGSAAREAGGARYVVITGASGLPVGLVRTERLLGVASELFLSEVARMHPPVVLVPAELPVGAAAQTPLVDRLPSGLPGVVIVSGDRPVGVWEREDVDVVALEFGGATRGGGGGGGLPSDWLLWGTIGIPKHARECGFAEDGRLCGDERTFPEKPDEMPECRNPRGLTPHRFVW